VPSETKQKKHSEKMESVRERERIQINGCVVQKNIICIYLESSDCCQRLQKKTKNSTNGTETKKK
jgi:hypothetical protein